MRLPSIVARPPIGLGRLAEPLRLKASKGLKRLPRLLRLRSPKGLKQQRGPLWLRSPRLRSFKT